MCILTPRSLTFHFEIMNISYTHKNIDLRNVYSINIAVMFLLTLLWAFELFLDKNHYIRLGVTPVILAFRGFFLNSNPSTALGYVVSLRPDLAT